MKEYFNKIDNKKSLYNYFDYDKNPYQKFRTSIIVNKISDLVNTRKSTVKILDIGCANGFIISKLVLLLKEKVVCTGIDFLNENIEEAKHLSNQNFICNDLSTNITVKFKEYDVILMSDVLYYLDNDVKLRLLKKISLECTSGTDILLCTRFCSTSHLYDSYEDLVSIFFNFENFALIDTLFWATNLLTLNSKLYCFLIRTNRFFFFFKYLFLINHRVISFFISLFRTKVKRFNSTNLFHHYRIK